MTPKKIVEELDKYIISQDDAKKNVAISLRNRFRRKEINDEILRNEIMPKNIILIGPTGVGKTEIARRLAKLGNSPFIKVEATKYTEVGYVGKDVESIIRDLVSITFIKTREEKLVKLEEELSPIIYEEIANEIKVQLNEEKKTVKKLIKEIKEGKYDEREIEVEVNNRTLPPIIEVYSGGIDRNIPDDLGGNIQDFLEGMAANLSGGKLKKVKKMKVKTAISYMFKVELEEKFDKESIIPEVIEKVEQDGIIFIDEIDKIAEREGRDTSNVSRQGVQRDILPIVEGTTVMTKFGPVKTEHILFIAAGAFSMSRPSDLMPELQGRFPIRVNLKSLTKEDFIRILTEVDNNLITQYTNLLEVDNVKIKFTEEAIVKLSEYAIQMNEKIEDIGARRLSTVFEEVLKEIMFEAPYKNKIKNITIDGKYVEDLINKTINKEDLNKYIL